MADYKTMYHKLFIEMNDTIEHFQRKLLEVEGIYISEEESIINLVKICDKKETEKKKESPK